MYLFNRYLISVMGCAKCHGAQEGDTWHCPPGLHRLLNKKNSTNIHRKGDFSTESSKGRMCHSYREIGNVLKENILAVKF